MFKEYKKDSPDRKRLAEAWEAGVGLQAVDGLSVSPYLRELAEDNIEGRRDLERTREILEDYYKGGKGRKEHHEADIASAAIASILSSSAFSFSVPGLMRIHRKMFDGVLPYAGKPRPYNIRKKEWILDGASVTYAPFEEIVRTLEYDLAMEKENPPRDFKPEAFCAHMARFAAGIWQIHPFCEGNTRTVATFVIGYLRGMGIEIDNAPFAEHARYFRNALVRANYANLPEDVREDRSFLEKFFGNAVFHEKNELRSRELHIYWHGKESVENLRNSHIRP